MRGLYIHIPFCHSLCNYCDFPKRIAKNDHMIDDYLIRLAEELNTYKDYFFSVETIYIGGGTPSSLNINQLKYLLELTKCFKNIKEFTFEANPESLTNDKIDLLEFYGVNRVSLGVESFDKESLQILGRKHDKTDVVRCVKALKEKNITNINIDLMFSLPNTTLQNIKTDLEEFYLLNIPHISYYSLILEEKTVFNYWYLNNNLKLIDNDLEACMYEYIIDDLKKHGYNQYEISNFTQNKESIHNKIYWTNNEYIGVGAGASGYLDGIRYYNEPLISNYNVNFISHQDKLSLVDKMNEEMMLGLRMNVGVNIEEIKEKYQIDPLEKYPLIKKYIEDGFLAYNSRLYLTRKGLMHGNDIFLLFVGDE